MAKKAYVAVFGYQTFPKFMSARMNYSAALFNSIYGWDFTSLRNQIGRSNWPGWVATPANAL